MEPRNRIRVCPICRHHQALPKLDCARHTERVQELDHGDGRLALWAQPSGWILCREPRYVKAGVTARSLRVARPIAAAMNGAPTLENPPRPQAK